MVTQEELAGSGVDQNEDVNASLDDLVDNHTGILDQKNPIFKETYTPSKIQVMLAELKRISKEFPNDKMIIVSEWTSYLKIIGSHLDSFMSYLTYSGSDTIEERNAVLETFKQPGGIAIFSNFTKILLLPFL